MKLIHLLGSPMVCLCTLGAAVSLANAGTIYQSGSSGTTYTDATGDQQGSANASRDITSVTVANDANNLYFTIDLNPTANIATGGAFNYIIGITSGSPSAGGDTSADATTHGNAYGRSISFDSSFGGMTDFVGIFGAGGSGSVASPYTSYGFNDYVYGTPGSSAAAGVWTKINTVSSGQPISMQPSTSTPNTTTVTIPIADFSSNFILSSGTTFDFDIDSTGTSGNQTAYDSLAYQSAIQSGTYSATYQFNETILDQYTMAAVPEPAAFGWAGAAACTLLFAFKARK